MTTSHQLHWIPATSHADHRIAFEFISLQSCLLKVLSWPLPPVSYSHNRHCDPGKTWANSCSFSTHTPFLGHLFDVPQRRVSGLPLISRLLLLFPLLVWSSLSSVQRLQSTRQAPLLGPVHWPLPVLCILVRSYLTDPNLCLNLIFLWHTPQLLFLKTDSNAFHLDSFPFYFFFNSCVLLVSQDTI